MPVQRQDDGKDYYLEMLQMEEDLKSAQQLTNEKQRPVNQHLPNEKPVKVIDAEVPFVYQHKSDQPEPVQEVPFVYQQKSKRKQKKVVKPVTELVQEPVTEPVQEPVQEPKFVYQQRSKRRQKKAVHQEPVEPEVQPIVHADPVDFTEVVRSKRKPKKESFEKIHVDEESNLMSEREVKFEKKLIEKLKEWPNEGTSYKVTDYISNYCYFGPGTPTFYQLYDNNIIITQSMSGCGYITNGEDTFRYSRWMVPKMGHIVIYMSS